METWSQWYVTDTDSALIIDCLCVDISNYMLGIDNLASFRTAPQLPLPGTGRGINPTAYVTMQDYKIFLYHSNASARV
jgi:hypothetical protein